MAEKSDETPKKETDSLAKTETPVVPAPADPAVAAPAKTNDKPAETESVEDLLALESPGAIAEPASPAPPPPKPPVESSREGNESETGEAGEIQTSWTCPVCGKVKQYRSIIIRHYKQSHPDRAQELITALPPMRTGRFEGKPNKPKAPSFADVISNNPAAPVDYQAMSGMMFDMTTGVAAGLLGQEWLPREDAPGSRTSKERDAMVSAIALYLKSKEVKDIPPGLMLTIVCIAYAGPRLREPSTKSKIVMAWTWVKMKITRKPKLKVL